ncbi:hypothetical protein MBM_07137 [Drepanopeziza brunnea f. sp. 'multigermtubi' MB_m1]|uniref:Uncharacterized protein n=1 Tax=Marssonina brunnea f. sp. multigermtubi (strain MB_m1) TaxID=1072389 RepID=K1WPM1_MARBU|nr:uncharacterized protein MBM_07137 [Drepanopeziza brunnea f. sp. 'multigermtubi' MB_m1]EKD14926.1 hypothetical protein MBM_07137 [Drepanopeziza brunnea f. sp. 'multigermtubi' MB_m1]
MRVRKEELRLRLTERIHLKSPQPAENPGRTTIIPDVVLHHDTFDNFGKTGWSRCGFNPAKEDKEYIFVVSEEDGDLIEELWKSFSDFFARYSDSALANVTCSIKMTAKLSVSQKGALIGQKEWRMGITISKANVVDLVDVFKLRTQVA